MRQIQLHKQAAKFVASIPPKHQQQIARALLRLQENPELHDTKKLHGYDYYRIDVGEYRVIYNWTVDTILVYIIGKRNDGDVYRKLTRQG